VPYTPEPSNDNTIFLTVKQVRERYGGISAMTLWRWLDNEAKRFPRPRYIGKARFWRLDELIAWEASLPREAA
jgi:predicted DNA-binding transcriptional regulator AlpA